MINLPVRRKLTTRTLNSFVSGYKFESIMDHADGQAILIAHKESAKQDLQSHERVFLKIGLERDTIHSIRREYQILKDIEHPHIVKPVDSLKGTVHQQKYRRMVLPYFKNGDLWSLTQRCEGLGEEVARVYASQILDALHHLHS